MTSKNINMGKITGNEPAMPNIKSIGKYEIGSQSPTGLTIRQHFAGMAMVALISNPELLKGGTGRIQDADELLKSYAEDGVKAADALIAELNK